MKNNERIYYYRISSSKLCAGQLVRNPTVTGGDAYVETTSEVSVVRDFIAPIEGFMVCSPSQVSKGII
jgi:hypothetical protein